MRPRTPDGRGALCGKGPLINSEIALKAARSHRFTTGCVLDPPKFQGRLEAGMEAGIRSTPHLILKPETRNPGTETRNPEPETLNPRP
jgi:hypothetical protein